MDAFKPAAAQPVGPVAAAILQHSCDALAAAARPWALALLVALAALALLAALGTALLAVNTALLLRLARRPA